ncbi:hypothetical protein N7474_005383 [Penicillium riverlandense]|uniref:uncharacterized protein n=1 Tax=Penicillium riverlandense TaxID=1903569 RepID=UPI002546CD43|nr:uncharacterized protein N7474_005383 [Penicillium riverlandense]KAJ5819792.1 hypothetical protein N7474_005383 [Penicillium riverlandense]
MSLPAEPRSWYRKGFIVSTDKKLLSIPAINHAFDQKFMYWVRPVPDDILQKIVDNSFCFGLYELVDGKDSLSESNYYASEACTTLQTEDLTQVGFARLVTDNITFAYFTDLYVLPKYQGLGLGGWIIDCIEELLKDLPYLRWVILRTSLEKSQQSYEKRLGMAVLKSGDISEGPVMMGRKGKAG